VTQGLSQASGTFMVPLADDQLQSRMMTIEELIESSEVLQLNLTSLIRT